MTIDRRIGVLGGTFDPVHLGHLAVAVEATRALALDEVLLVPSHMAPHRWAEPSASMFHRFAMVALATLQDERFAASDLELNRPGASFTADTLRGLQAAGCSPLQLFFLTGADAFAEIATWRDFPHVLTLAHFVVVSRPGVPSTTLPGRLPELASRMLTLQRGAQAPPENQPEPRVFLIECPTPDVSSTGVRARARAGRPLAGLVPPEVDAYIRRHGLYGAPTGRVPDGRPAAGDLHEQSLEQARPDPAHPAR